MPLCSYDNTVNQKYNIQKGLDMKRETAAERKARLEAEAAAKAAKEQVEEKTEEQTKEKTEEQVEEGMTILEALEEAKRSRSVARKGWSKHIANTSLVIRRGHTLPELKRGKHFDTYIPSIIDVMEKDWYVVEGN